MINSTFISRAFFLTTLTSFILHDRLHSICEFMKWKEKIFDIQMDSFFRFPNIHFEIT